MVDTGISLVMKVSVLPVALIGKHVTINRGNKDLSISSVGSVFHCS